MELPIKALPDDLTTLLTPGKLFIFTKTDCPFCELTKEYFHEMQTPYEYVVCDTLGITDKHKDQLYELTGAKSYPRIFAGKNSVGGFDDLRKADDEGKLEKLFKSEGIPFKEDWWFNGLDLDRKSGKNEEREEGFARKGKISKMPDDVSTLLSPGKVFLFTRHDCPFCELTKEYLEEKEIHYEYIYCDDLGITDEHKDQLFKMTGGKSYPRIFVGKESVGGFDDLRQKDEKGIFEKMLEKEGITFKKDWYTSQP